MNTALKPFGVMLGMDDEMEARPGSTLPIIWEANGKLTIGYRDRHNRPAPQDYGFDVDEMLETPSGLVLGLYYMYDRRPGLADYHVRKLPLRDGTVNCQKRLNLFAKHENRPKYGNLHLKKILWVGSSRIQMLTDIIEPNDSWFGYMLADGRIVVGPDYLLYHDIAQLLTYGHETMSRAQFYDTVLDLHRYYPDFGYEWRVKGLRAFYQQMRGRGPEDYWARNARYNSESWAEREFGVCNHAMAMPWI